MLRLTRKECQSAWRTLDWVLSATRGTEEEIAITKSILDKLKVVLKTTEDNVEIKLIDENH